MKIIYYKSRVCPRCISTNRLLTRVRLEHPKIEIEEIEVLTHLSRAVQDGIWMLPTLIVGERRFHHAPPIDELLAALKTTPAW
jgi:glutaredoxin